MDWRLRTFAPGDDARLVAAWNRTLVRDPISVALFRRQTLLDPNFQAEGCLLAERAGNTGSDGEPLGFVVTVAPRVTKLFARTIDVGRIVGLGVVPEARKQGIGTGLLESALDFLRRHDRRRVHVAAHEYYAAGVDKQAYPEGLAFLIQHGFQETRESVAMGRVLYDLEWPESVRAAEARLHSEGIEVRCFQPGDTYALATFFRAEFPTWLEFFLRKLDGRHDLDEMVVAVHDQAVVGYCQHLDSDHVGPFGVAAAYRNRGIGSVLLYCLLGRMREKGYKFAWFGETSRALARSYYQPAGFQVTRVYAALVRDLEQVGSSGPSI